MYYKPTKGSRYLHEDPIYRIWTRSVDWFRLYVRRRSHRQTDRQTDGQTDRQQTHTHTHTHTDTYTETYFIGLVFLRKCRNKTKKRSISFVLNNFSQTIHKFVSDILSQSNSLLTFLSFPICSQPEMLVVLPWWIAIFQEGLKANVKSMQNILKTKKFKNIKKRNGSEQSVS